MIPIRIDGPAVEPVSVVAMRAWLRLDEATEDATLADLIRAARGAIEAATRLVLAESRWRIVLDAWPGVPVAVPLEPLSAVAAVALLAADGTETALASDLVRLDAGRLAFAAPPAGSDGRRVAVEIVAGYEPAAIPPPLLQAVRLLVARWYEHRGDEPSPDAALPGDVLALIAPHRRLRL